MKERHKKKRVSPTDLQNTKEFHSRQNEKEISLDNIIFGRNTVLEALKSGREIEKLLILKSAEGSIKKIEGMARDNRIAIQYVDKATLDRVTMGPEGAGNHQGVAATTTPYSYCEVEDLLSAAAEKGEAPFVIILDGIEDPHNLGAIMRTADGAGAHGIIIPKRRAASLTDTVAKASAGAVEYMPVAKVSNLVQTIEKLKTLGLWIAACDMDGQPYFETDLKGPIAIVIGSEGQGVSRLIREKCDYLVSLPMEGKITSLNASNAAAVLMYEINRQRKGK
jgi:23S rRNA (guanosine2251-2'-O)-methyltransferase